MFSMCSELTPRAHIPDTRIPQLMQPWRPEGLILFMQLVILVSSALQWRLSTFSNCCQSHFGELYGLELTLVQLDPQLHGHFFNNRINPFAQPPTCEI